MIGARVEVWPPFEESEPLEAMAPPWYQLESDKGGIVELQASSRPGFLLLVDHPGFEPYWRALDPAPWPGEVRLVAGVVRRGRVEPARAAGTGGRVCATWEEWLERWHLNRTWERCAPIVGEGTFELQGLGPQAVRLRAEVPGYLLAESTSDGRSTITILRLESGRLLAGRVLTGARREPVPGASIVAHGSAAVSSDAQGRFRIALGELPATLRLSAPGFRSERLTVDEGRRYEKLVVLLERGPRALFSLSDPESRPLTSARPWVDQAGPAGSWTSWTFTATAAKDGRFAVDLPRAGRYRLRISVAGLSPTRAPVFQVGDGEACDLGNLVVERGAVIRGTAVDSQTNRPLAGVEIAWVPMGLRFLRTIKDQHWPRTVSDATGRFSLSGLGAGRAVVTLRRAGYPTRRVGIVLGRNELEDLGPLWLDKGAELRGRVTTEAGDPIPGLLVQVSEADLGLLTPSVTTRTSATGELRLPALAPGRYRMEVRADHPVLVEEIEVPAGGGEHRIELVVPGGPLEGRVLDAGRPVAGGAAFLDPVLQPGREPGKIQVQFEGRRQLKFTQGTKAQVLAAPITADGRFAFAAVPPGAFVFSYQDEAGNIARRAVEVPGDRSGGFDVRIDGFDRRGQIVDRGSRAGIAASLRVRDRAGALLVETEADAEGWFELRDLAGEDLALQVSAQGYRTRVLTVEELEPAGARAEIELESAASGEILVRLKDTAGDAAGGALVTLLGDAGGVLGSVPTDRDGARRFTDLPAGSYFVVVSDPGAGLVASDRLELAAGEALAVDMDLGAGSALTLSCAPDQCGSAAVERLTIRRAGGPELTAFLPSLAQALRLPADGRFHLGFLGPGVYRIELETRGATYSATLRVDTAEPILAHLK